MAQTNPFHCMTLCLMPAVFAVYVPMCAPRVTPSMRPWETPMAQLWEKPLDLEARDLYDGPWGPERAPDPHALYTFVAKKQHGTNPGVTVTDARGREWSVKQPPRNDQGAEGPVEVVLSRILSAVGYHQPPVYFVPSFTMTDATGTHTEVGGRFRLKVDMLAKRGEWSWQQNPFVGTKPYQGLLVILLMFDSSDLKNVNNTLYELKPAGGAPRLWYVVRDLGTALGETGRLTPKRSDPDLFERHRFVNGVKDGYVELHYHGWHQELLRRRIKPFNMNGERYYTFVTKNVRFVVLDSDYVDPKQMVWLDETLRSSGDDWKICYFHHPLYSDGGRHGPQVDLRVLLEPVFVRYGVNVVFSGHDHVYERLKPQRGIHYFVSGAAGQVRKGDVRRSERTAAAFDQDQSFMLVEIAGHDLSFQAISRTGTTVDSGVLHREPRP